MSDIFQEVDEEVRREKLRQLWDKYSGVIIAVAFIVVLGVAGWRGWQWYEVKKAGEAGAAYEAADTLANEGKHAEAQAAFAKVAAEGTAGYRTLARFREASELARTDKPAAVKVYDGLAADSGIGQVLQDLAHVRAGLLLVDSATLPELTTRLEPLTARDRTFRHTAREILALAAFRTGDRATARRWFDMITTDAETPEAIRARVDMLITLSADAKG